MDAVIRPVNDRFLRQVAFPAFEAGVMDAAAGIQLLLDRVGDESVRSALEIVLDRGLEGSFFSMDADRWLDTVYRLLFCEWLEDGGWKLSGDYLGYAGDWEQTLHLALMLEHPRYPYWDREQAELVRDSCLEAPYPDLGMAGLVCGLWDPFPAFPPDQVLSTTGRGAYNRAEGLAVADWSYRPANAVKEWSRQLSGKLSHLLRREEKRLHPVEMPEAMDILDFWMGQLPDPPLLTVAFSGLGQHASEWVRDLGFLVRQVRSAASLGQGLTAVVTTRRLLVDRGPL